MRLLNTNIELLLGAHLIYAEIEMYTVQYWVFQGDIDYEISYRIVCG